MPGRHARAVRLLAAAAAAAAVCARAADSPPRADAAARALPWWPAATDGARLAFAAVPHLSDEFSARDLEKWSFAGDVADDASGCAAWMGPPPLYLDSSGNSSEVSGGELRVALRSVGDDFFVAREYWCVRGGGAGDGWCSWDRARAGERCRGAGDGGKYEDWRCRKAPHCFPKGQTTYRGYVAGQVQSRRTMHYGFVEVRVRPPSVESKTVAAAWLNNHFWDPPYSGVDVTGSGKWEATSRIRQRFWYEIDFVELSMNWARGSQYVPNVHLFADYDGRHTSKPGEPNGPIIQDSAIAGDKANSMSWNPGPVYEHPRTFDKEWSTFGMWWDEDEIRFFVDGVERRRQKNRYMHAPQFIKFSLLSNQEWLGGLPAQGAHAFEIDYVRTWSVEKSSAVKKDAAVIPGTRPLDDSMGAAKPPPMQWSPTKAAASTG